MTNQSRRFIGIAALFGAIAVGLGAFGAHALKDLLTSTGRLDTYETAVLYHFIHTLAILGVGIILNANDNSWLKRAAWCFTGGMIIFSGSLYLLCFTGIGILGAITPVGGVLFILGWLFLAIFGFRIF